MTLAFGLLLGVGLVFTISPLLWPAGAARVTSARGTPGTVLRERLSQAGLPSIGVGALSLVSALLAVSVGAVCFALVAVVPIAALAAVVAAAAPTLLVSWRARSRRRAIRVIWPDLVDHLVSAVRSGLALPDSVVSLARVAPESARPSFEEFERTYRATGNFALGIDQLKAHLADPTADRILETLRMSREVGGSELTTVLRNLASYLRQEAAIRSEVEARQSWVVNAAKLGVAAPWIILLLLASRPEAAAAYNSPQGVVIIVGGLVLSFVAYRVMLALGRLPEERRWFR